MPKGIASLFSTLTSMELFMIIEETFNRKGLILKLPQTGKVQVWNLEGEMMHLDKEVLISDADLSNYLIQFWWMQMDDICIKITYEGSLTKCDIYLDGLLDYQLKDILALLILIALDNHTMRGFIVDRKERSSKCEWSEFFCENDYLDRNKLEEYGLNVCRKYQVDKENINQIMDLAQDSVIVAISNCEKNVLMLYLL